MSRHVILPLLGLGLALAPAAEAASHRYALLIGGTERATQKPPAPGQAAVDNEFRRAFFDAGFLLRNDDFDFDGAVFFGNDSADSREARSTLEVKDSATDSVALVRAGIAKLTARVKSGAIRAGDEILVFLFSHAHPTPQRETNDPIHLFSMEDGRMAPATELAPLRAATEAHGVRLAILDFSCLSGMMIAALGGPQTCVITGGTQHTNSSIIFTQDFMLERRGPTLEKHFLNVLRDIPEGIAVPAISTAVGRTLTARLAALEPTTYEQGFELAYWLDSRIEALGASSAELPARIRAISPAGVQALDAYATRVGLPDWVPRFHARLAEFERGLNRLYAIRKQGAVRGGVEQFTRIVDAEPMWQRGANMNELYRQLYNQAYAYEASHHPAPNEACAQFEF